jgi:hypothetical protein
MLLFQGSAQLCAENCEPLAALKLASNRFDFGHSPSRSAVQGSTAQHPMNLIDESGHM